MAVTLPPAFQHLAQHGLMATLAAVLRAGVAIRGVPQWPAPALFTAVIVIDFIIAALVGPPSVTQSPNVRAALYAEPKNDSSMAAGWLPAYAQATPRPGSQIEALGRIELAAPTVTPEPVITATPIPQISTAWQSTLPLEPAWNGAGECGSQFVVAPTGGGTLAWPGDNRYLSGRNYYPAWHPGIDIAAQLGDPLYAADSGVVVYSGWNTQGYGNMLIVDHGNGWHTLYAHLSQINVSCNDPVWQGQVIGLAGSTGNSTGPHLHFEVRSPNGRVNPWTVLSP
jgi:murein DD-endopeptidase MepM/ murein hydrolase activator NlpD